MRLPALVGRLNHKFANGSMLSGRSFVSEKELTMIASGRGGRLGR